MSKTSGLGWTVLSLDTSGGSANDIRNDVTNFDFATPRGVWEFTGVDKSAVERGLLLADLSGNLNGAFDPGSNLAHATLKTVPSTSVARTLTFTHSGQTLAGEVLVTDYSLSRAQTGEFTWTAPFVLADGTVPTWS